MTLMAMIDYSLVVIFFIGVAGLLCFIARSRPGEASAQQTAPPPQEAKGTYAFVAVLFVLLIALAFFARRSQVPGSST
jgi:preprotein translocase subunit SecG